MVKPTKIIILGTEIKIIYVAKMSDPNLLGTYCHEDKLITVVKDKDWKSHIFHECIHAAMIISGVAEYFTDEINEMIVVCIENALKDFFRIKYKN
jgi:hypothetical protein